MAADRLILLAKEFSLGKGYPNRDMTSINQKLEQLNY